MQTFVSNSIAGFLIDKSIESVSFVQLLKTHVFISEINICFYTNEIYIHVAFFYDSRKYEVISRKKLKNLFFLKISRNKIQNFRVRLVKSTE